MQLAKLLGIMAVFFDVVEGLRGKSDPMTFYADNENIKFTPKIPRTVPPSAMSSIGVDSSQRSSSPAAKSNSLSSLSSLDDFEFDNLATDYNDSAVAPNVNSVQMQCVDISATHSSLTADINYTNL